MKIQAIVDETGFEANGLARRLKEKKTNQIVVFLDRHQGLYWGTFHNEIIQELYREAKEKGYCLVISSSSADSFEEDENDGFYLIKHGFCDGAIMFDTKNNDKRIEFLKRHKLPFVIIGKDKTHFDTPYVDLDNEFAGYLGASFLVEHGYKKFVFFLGSEDFIVNQERAFGFKKYCEENNIKPVVFFGITDMKVAYEKTDELLRGNDIEAIFISGDERALGVYRAIHERGLNIGKDIAVLGIDNVKMGEFMYPPLTTIDQPKVQISKTAMEILFEQLSNNENTITRTLITPVIVKRCSV